MSLESQISRDNKSNIFCAILIFLFVSFFFIYFCIDLYKTVNYEKYNLYILTYCRLFIKKLNVQIVSNNCIISRLEMENFIPSTYRIFMFKKNFENHLARRFQVTSEGIFQSPHSGYVIHFSVTQNVDRPRHRTRCNIRISRICTIF